MTDTPAPPSRKCLHCFDLVVDRGLCAGHLADLEQAVKRNKESYWHAEKCGQCLPSTRVRVRNKGGRPPRRERA